MKGRAPDPGRAKRGTGNRPKPGEAKKTKTPLPAVVTPAASAELYPPPDGVSVEAAHAWRAAVADLGGANHMREAYLPALRAYVEAAAVHAQASAQVNAYGLLVESDRGPVPNPALRIQKDAAATMLRFAEALGLTPSGRIRLGLMEVTGMSLLAGIGAALDGPAR